MENSEHIHTFPHMEQTNSSNYNLNNNIPYVIGVKTK